MKPGGKGGAKTQGGKKFEAQVGLLAVLGTNPNYEVRDNSDRTGKILLFKGNRVGEYFEQTKFKFFLKRNGINWTEILSKELRPDGVCYVERKNTVYIVEIKYQSGVGSVDEKLQTCDFKKKQYSKLLSATGMQVEYIYILNDWFKKPAYRDVLNYIRDMKCYYFFNHIPLSSLSLPEN